MSDRWASMGPELLFMHGERRNLYLPSPLEESLLGKMLGS